MKGQNNQEKSSDNSSVESHSMQDLREILAHTQPMGTSVPPSPVANQKPSPVANQNSEVPLRFSPVNCPVIDEEDVNGGTRPLVRFLSEYRPSGAVGPPPTRRFSLFARRHSTNPQVSNDFTSAWLRTSNFDLNRDPVAGGSSNDNSDPMGVLSRDDSMEAGVAFQVGENIERPDRLPRRLSLDDESNDGTPEPETTARSAEDMWIHNKTAKFKFNHMLPLGLPNLEEASLVLPLGLPNLEEASSVLLLGLPNQKKPL
ncbi:unnamed protein product [Caenorhabditis auriculariae]|uniref:Uncharacterized protein n=1 Tax=Caenorhabditis auriculariae TaxID=2777116 RepID=A0A8S1HBS8_9PELO|nr:unnamed protein product [Caenorhabditis auriculariae]